LIELPGQDKKIKKIKKSTGQKDQNLLRYLSETGQKKIPNN